MKLSKKAIKIQFQEAEKTLEWCWQVLSNMKYPDKTKKEAPKQIIIFQDKLAALIFNLHIIREEIISEEKRIVRNKSKYSDKWFVNRLRVLSSFKKGLDKVVNIAKSFGDAYAYFFYRFDLDMLTEHLTHQRVINSTAGIGEWGEIEFLKSIKQIDGNFALFHGITNILRFGDYSFVDLKNNKVIEIGELKTKQKSETEYEFHLHLLKYSKTRKDNRIETSKKVATPKSTRKERQLEGISTFLKNAKDTATFKVDLENNFYYKDLEFLFNTTKVNTGQCKKVSPGLAFSVFKFKKMPLFSKLFSKDVRHLIDKIEPPVLEIATQLIKPDSNNNSIILGQLLYDPDFSDKNTPGTAPLFWCPLNIDLLKKLYFLEFHVMSLYNPIHLINDVEALGFIVESKYADNTNTKGRIHIIKDFYLFISYIINHLQTESFVVDSLTEAVKKAGGSQDKSILIKLQQRVFR